MENCKRRKAQRAPMGSSERTLFSKFTSPEQSYAAALRQDTTPATTATADRWGKREPPCGTASATTGISGNKSVRRGFNSA
jgi:hypothetical protein